VNAAPVAVNDSGTVLLLSSVTIAVLANDTDSDGYIVPATLQIVSGPSKGSASVVSGGIRYSAPALFAGSTTLRYQICDNGGACAQATVTITILSIL
jgi:hypothetical protein